MFLELQKASGYTHMVYAMKLLRAERVDEFSNVNIKICGLELKKHV